MIPSAMAAGSTWPGKWRNYGSKGRPSVLLDGRQTDAGSKEAGWLKKLANVPEVVDNKEDFQAWIHAIWLKNTFLERLWTTM